jgi:uncharacterized protein (TIGR02265 family)
VLAQQRHAAVHVPWAVDDIAGAEDALDPSLREVPEGALETRVVGVHVTDEARDAKRLTHDCDLALHGDLLPTANGRQRPWCGRLSVARPRCYTVALCLQEQLMDLEGFSMPDWSASLDLEERLAAVPADAMNKGILFVGPVKAVKEKTGKKVGRGDYGLFTDYPVREMIEVVLESAHLLHPDLPPREGIRHIGQAVFPRLKESAPGRMLFALAGNNIFSAVRLVGRAHALGSCTRAQATVVDDHTIVVEIRNAWVFPENYQLGIYEGALPAYGRTGTVLVRRRSLCDVDLKLTLVEPH